MEIFIAVYMGGVATAMWALYYPAWKIIKSVNPNNLLVIRPFISFFVVLFFFTVFFPVIVFALIFPTRARRFIEGFAKGAEK